MRAAALFVALVLAGAVALAAAPRILMVPLQWSLNIHGDHPTALPSMDVTGGMHTLRVEKIVDRREKDREIGENTEKPDHVSIQTTSDVAAFVANNLVTELRSAGLDLVTENPDLVLSLELIEFWATERSSYRASVRVRARLTDAGGHELWSGIVGGVGENWGRSLKVVNYNETFSNSVFDLAVALLSQSAFQGHLRRQAF